jgi:hypothetical protein
MHYLFRACSRLFRVKLNHAVPLTLLSLIFRDVAFIHSSKVFERLAQLEAVHRIRQVLHADSVARGRGAPSLILFNLLASLNHKGLGRSSHLVVVATHLWGLQILVRVVPVSESRERNLCHCRGRVADCGLGCGRGDSGSGWGCCCYRSSPWESGCDCVLERLVARSHGLAYYHGVAICGGPYPQGRRHIDYREASAQPGCCWCWGNHE